MKDNRLEKATQCRRDNKDAEGFMQCIAEEPNMESIMLRLDNKNKARGSNSQQRRIAPAYKDAVRLIQVIPVKNTKKGTDKYKKGYVMGSGDKPKKKKDIFKRILGLGVKGMKKGVKMQMKGK